MMPGRHYLPLVAAGATAVLPVVLREGVIFHPELPFAFVVSAALLVFVRGARAGWSGRYGARRRRARRRRGPDAADSGGRGARTRAGGARDRPSCRTEVPGRGGRGAPARRGAVVGLPDVALRESRSRRISTGRATCSRTVSRCRSSSRSPHATWSSTRTAMRSPTTCCPSSTPTCGATGTGSTETTGPRRAEPTACSCRRSRCSGSWRTPSCSPELRSSGCRR